MPDETPRDKTTREQDDATKKDLPPKPVDKNTSDEVKGGFGKPQVEAMKKIM